MSASGRCDEAPPLPQPLLSHFTARQAPLVTEELVHDSAAQDAAQGAAQGMDQGMDQGAAQGAAQAQGMDQDIEFEVRPTQLVIGTSSPITRSPPFPSPHCEGAGDDGARARRTCDRCALA